MASFVGIRVTVVLLDSTTLRLLCEFRNRPWSNDGIDRVLAGPAVEAMILYDAILVDRQAVSGDVAISGSLGQLASFLEYVEIDLRHMEDVYVRAFHSNFPSLCAREFERDAHLIARSQLGMSLTVGERLAQRHVQAGVSQWARAQRTGQTTFAKNSPAGVFGSLPRVARHLIDQCFDIHLSGFRQDMSYQNACRDALARALRAFYYTELQKDLGSDLVLHPGRAAIIPRQLGLGRHLIEVFDQRARSEYRERTSAWLGSAAAGLPIPLLLSYFFTRLKKQRGCDPLDLLLEIRASKRAVGFRAAINELREAIENRENLRIDAVVQELEHAAKDWSKRLGGTSRTRKLGISVPLIGLRTDVEVPDPKIRRRTTADRLLLFVHELLSRS